MHRGRFLKRVLLESEKYKNNQFKKYFSPIIRIQDDILAEAKKGKYYLEIEKNLDDNICKHFEKEGFQVNKFFDEHLESTEIKWKD